MRAALSQVKCRLAAFWNGLRAWCGDSAYENYAKFAVRNGQSKILSPAEFYVQQLNKKYSQPNRCC